MSDNTGSESKEAQDASASQGTIAEEPQLYAGKFKSVEDLEKAYKEGFAVHLKNKELETRLSEVTLVPEQYTVPGDVQLRDAQINEIKELAQSAGMNQNQFENAVKKFSDSVANKLNAIEERKQSIGEDKINVVKGYIDNQFAGFDGTFKEDVLNKVIKDDKMLEKVMSDRENQVNSTAPGINQVSAAANRQEKMNDMNKAKYDAAIQAKLDPRNVKARERYIQTCRDVSYAKRELNNQ